MCVKSRLTHISCAMIVKNGSSPSYCRNSRGAKLAAARQKIFQTVAGDICVVLLNEWRAMGIEPSPRSWSGISFLLIGSVEVFNGGARWQIFYSGRFSGAKKATPGLGDSGENRVPGAWQVAPGARWQAKTTDQEISSVLRF